MPVHGESDGPKVVTQGQRSTVICVRLLFSVLLIRVHRVTKPLLKLFLGFAEIMQQASQRPLLRSVEVVREFLRSSDTAKR